MKLAKRELQKSQGYLYAENSKEDHFVNATGLVVAAIAEIEESIKLDSHNHHAASRLEATLAAPLPDKRNLRLALEHLRLGKEFLEAAKPDQGGHRDKAIAYTNRAIALLEQASAGTD
ncbi:MAG TPA: hypothetical protein VIF64_13005 [Pyrinomonadaceae bacterium]|jgi:hypothetical protein